MISTRSAGITRMVTPYDAAYAALAELTGATLVTGDERITAVPGTHCDVQIIK